MGRLRPQVRACLTALLLLTLLVPSALFAWKSRSMAHLGAWHDDAVYWVSAKSLADGGGYRLLNLPGQPSQTKYPPLYPLLLSMVWRIDPQFPQNATLLMAAQWCFLPVLVALLWAWFRRIGFSYGIAVLLTSVVALCPMTTMFATTPLTEIPFLIAVLGTMLLVGDGRSLTTKRALCAGLCAAAAVLIRTNGIALAAAVPVALLWTRPRVRHIAAFLAPVVVAFASWELWCVSVHAPAHSDILAYYTDYAGFYRRTFSLTALPSRLWTNVDGLLTSTARLILWTTTDATLYRQLCWAVSLFSIPGWVKLFRAGYRTPVVFAVFFAALLLVWNFPPDQRFVYPLLPFAVAALVLQISEIVSRIRVEWTAHTVSNRVAAAVMGAIVAAFVPAIALLDWNAYRDTLPQWMESQKMRSAARCDAYAWIRRNTASDAVVAAYDDPLLYLYTGRRAISVAVLPSLVYEGSDTALGAYIGRTVRDWSGSGVANVLTTPYDFSREYQATARKAEVTELQTSSWKPLLSERSFTVYGKSPRETQ